MKKSYLAFRRPEITKADKKQKKRTLLIKKFSSDIQRLKYVNHHFST